MADIFLSYRIQDSLESVGHIYDRLTQRFETQRIFWDKKSIEAGGDWRTEITTNLAQAKVVLIFINDEWLKSFAARAGTDDVLLDEIHTALHLKSATVIPVLLNDTQMPAEAALPAKIKKLAGLQASRVRAGADFDRDMDELLKVIVSKLVRRPAWLQRLFDVPRLLWAGIVGLGVIVALLAGLVQIGVIPPFSPATDEPPSAATNAPPSAATDAPPSAATDEPPSAATDAPLPPPDTQFVVSRDYDGVQICTLAQVSLQTMVVTFVNANEQYTLGDVFPNSRQTMLENQGCVCLVKGDKDLPAQCRDGNSSSPQASSSDWVNLRLALSLNGQTCYVEASCKDNCPCE